MTEGAFATARRDTAHPEAWTAPARAQPPDHARPSPPAATLSDPAIAHPANTSARAATMQTLQRGAGNQAALAAAAALAPATPAIARGRDPPNPRDQEAREDDAVESVAEQEPEPEPPTHEPPLVAEPIRLPYDPAEQMAAPPTSAGPRGAARAAQAGAVAQSAYSSIREHGTRLHQATLDDANRAIEAAVRTHDEAVGRLSAQEEQRRSEIDSAEQVAILAIDQRADATAARVRTAHAAASKALVGIVRTANGHVGAMNTLAQHQAGKVVTYAQSLYADAFEAAGKECDDQERAAEKGLDEWASDPMAHYPPKGDALDVAYAEVRRNAVPSLAKNDKEGLQAMQSGVHKQLGEVEPKLTAQVGTALGDAIRKNIKSGIDRGHDTVAAARKQALGGLDHQLQDGLHAVEKMRRDGRASVHSEGQAARARLTSVMRARRAALRGDADRALEGIVTGAQPGLRLYAASPERFAGMVHTAAARGPDGVTQTARTAPQSIRAAMDNALRLHGDRVAVNATAMRGVFAGDEQRTVAEVDAEMARARDAIAHVTEQIGPQLDGTASSQQAAFAAIADGVRVAGENWAKSYEQGMVATMAAFRKASDESFHTFMTGEEPKDARRPSMQKATAKQGDAGKEEKAVFFNATKKAIADEFARYTKADDIAAVFEPKLKKFDTAEENKLAMIETNAKSDAESGHGRKLNEELRNITGAEGAAIREMSHKTPGGDIDEVLLLYHAIGNIDDDDYHAAIAYLDGNRVQGARFEIKSSLGFWSDDKGRIETVLRNLSADELEALNKEGSDAIEAAKGWWHLSGTDLDVFDALMKGERAKADAIRALQKVEEAKRSGEYDKLNAGLTDAFSATNYGRESISADRHRAEVQREMAKLLRGRSVALTAAGPAIDDQTVIKNFVSEQVEVPIGDEMGTTVTLQIGGANKKLALALIDNDPDSLAVKTARLGVEAQRPDGPTVLNLDKALVDERLKPTSELTEDGKSKTPEMLAADKKTREEAQKDHDTVIVDFARQYCDARRDVSPLEAKRLAREKFGNLLKDSKGGDEYVGSLIDAGYPTPEAAARGMSYAMYSSFWHTDKDLMRQIISRMNADEIGQMRAGFKSYTGKDLYDELGVYHHGGFFTTLSGDTRLEFERLLLGQPRNDFERAQLALFTIEQQKRETGAVGRFLAGGSYAEQAMEKTESDLIASLGGKAEVNSEGHLVVPTGVFEQNRYNDRFAGANREKFDVATALAKAVSENYAARIDSIASAVTTLIAVIGTVVAAVVTVATGGLASPLLLGAIALTAGLAGMGAHRLISGGRYGWHEAARDFGMTLVQALTAGIGAQLAIVSRGGMAAIEAAQLAEEAAAAGVATTEQLALREGAQMGNILGSKGADLALIGAATGGMTGAGQALFNERTWEKGAGHAFAAVLEGTIRGSLAGVATSVASQAVENLPLGKLAGGRGGTIGEVMGGLGGRPGSLGSAAIGRGVLKSLSSSFGAMAGKSVEVGWDKAAGRFTGSAAEEIVHAGAFAALQGGLEGMAEAPAQRYHSNRQAARVQALREQAEAARGIEQTRPPTVPAPPALESEPPRFRPIEEPGRPRLTPAVEHAAEDALGPRVPSPRMAKEPAPGGATPRGTGAEPPEAELSQLRMRGDVALLPEETVIRGPNPTSADEAHLIYGNTIADQPDREAAVYRNPETGEFIVIQGEATTVGVRSSAGGELEAPQPGGSAQRWKAILDGPDTGRWELVAHFHPAEQVGGAMSMPRRMPSGVPGDFQVMEGESAIADGPRQSRIHYLDKGEWGYTDFGFDTNSAKARYWVDHADAVGGGRTRAEFESIDQYREWFRSNFGHAPDAATAPPRAPAMPAVSEQGPPKRVVDHIDTLLKSGAPIEYPKPELVAKARAAFENGTATPGDLDILMKKSVADVRTRLATDEIPHPSMAMDDWNKFVFDLAELSWYNVRGQCGVGRDFIATSLGTLLMDADRPIVFQRYQAKEVFGVGKHGFAIVAVKDEPGWSFILDPTFAQFMRPEGRLFNLAEATGNVLREHPTGAFMARDLLRDGYIPLTQENATLYARAMGVPEDQAAAMGARLLRGDAADLTERVGGPDRRPPVTHITSNDIDTISVHEMQGMVARHVDEISGRGDGHATERAQLADLQLRLDEALARGPVRPEAEGGPSAPRREPGAPRSPLPAGEDGPVPDALGVGVPPIAPAVTMRGSVSEPVGRSFHGAVVAQPNTSFSKTARAIDDLTASGGVMEGRLTRIGEDHPPEYALRTGNGDVRVRLEIDNDMPASRGRIPVATVTPENGVYVLRVSGRAGSLRNLTRGIAGQLTEIAAGHGRSLRANALGKATKAALSPADEGKIAEFATLARALEGAKTPEARNAIRLEAEEFVHALGLTGVNDDVRATARAAFEAQGASPATRQLLDEAIRDAPTNPFLLALGIDGPTNRSVLEAALARIDRLESAKDAAVWRARLVKAVAQSLIDRRILRPVGGRRQHGGGSDFADVGELMGVDLVRSLQDNARLSPVAQLVHEAGQVAGHGLSQGGGMAPSDLRKAEPGFEATLKVGAKTVRASAWGEIPEEALTAEPALIPGGNTVDDLLARRNELRRQLGELEVQRETASTKAEEDNIGGQLSKLQKAIDRTTELLGMEAGRAYAGQHLPGFVEVPLAQVGAGTTDLVFAHPDGRIVVIECKGGGARLGVRRDATGRLYVQQGTREYLDSLAKAMIDSSSTQLQDLGERLTTALDSDKPLVEYHVVRQPIDDEGGLGAPQYGHFDLAANK